MNDYITKPYDEEDFFRKIEYVMNNSLVNKSKSDSKEDEIHTQIPLYDLSGLEKMSRGDNAFMTKMMAIFVVLAKENSLKIEQLLAQNDWQTMKIIAHKMKPSIDQLEITSLKEIIRFLEQYSGESQTRQVWVKNAETVIDILRKIGQEFEIKLNQSSN